MVSLPSGGVVGGSLAFSLGAAITLVYLHRRRRYRPLLDRTTAPTGPECGPASRTLRRAYLTTHGDENPDHTRPDALRTEKVSTQLSRPILATTQHRVSLASREGREVLFTISELGSLGLDGPGAADAARAVLASTAAAGADIARVIVTDTDLRHLLGHHDDASARTEHEPSPVPPSVTVTNTPAEALGLLETEVMHRTRLLDSYDAVDITTFRRDNPDEEALPAVVLITRPQQRLMPRLQAVLTLGLRHDLCAIVLGPWPEGTTCHVDPTGHITEVDGPARQRLADAALFQLPTADTADLLAVLAEASGQPTPCDDAHAPDTGPDGVEPDESPPEGPAIAQTNQLAPSDQPAETAPSNSTALATVSPRIDANDRPVRLAVLGPVRVSVGSDGEISTGLRSRARQLLAYLASHREGVTLAHTLAELWPDDAPDSAATQFHVATSNIRRVLHRATGISHGRFIVHSGGRYQLDTDVIDVDLWRFQRHLDQVNTSDTADTSTHDRVRALNDAIHTYQADFTARLAYEWAEPLREHLHRLAMDACTRLADHHERAGDIDQCLAVLDHAIALDGYDEALYQRAIRLSAKLNRPDAIRRLYQTLQNRLIDLDVDPDEETERLVHDTLATHTTATKAHSRGTRGRTEYSDG